MNNVRIIFDNQSMSLLRYVGVVLDAIIIYAVLGEYRIIHYLWLVFGP